MESGDSVASSLNSRKYIVITAYSGSGKSFLGDYLELYCGFAHVDGDEPLFMPQHADIAKRFRQVYYDFWLSGQDAPVELWQPVYRLICDWAKAAGETNDRVVITQSMYSKQARTFVREQLGSENVAFVHVHVDEDVLIRGLLARDTQDWPNLFGGKGIEQCWDEGVPPLDGQKEQYGEFAFESYRQFKLKDSNIRGFVPLSKDEGPYSVLDATARDDSVSEKLLKILGLPCPAENIDLERIKKANSQRQMKYKEGLVSLK